MEVEDEEWEEEEEEEEEEPGVPLPVRARPSRSDAARKKPDQLVQSPIPKMRGYKPKREAYKTKPTKPKLETDDEIDKQIDLYLEKAEGTGIIRSSKIRDALTEAFYIPSKPEEGMKSGGQRVMARCYALRSEYDEATPPERDKFPDRVRLNVEMQNQHGGRSEVVAKATAKNITKNRSRITRLKKDRATDPVRVFRHTKKQGHVLNKSELGCWAQHALYKSLEAVTVADVLALKQVPPWLTEAEFKELRAVLQKISDKKMKFFKLEDWWGSSRVDFWLAINLTIVEALIEAETSFAEALKEKQDRMIAVHCKGGYLKPGPDYGPGLATKRVTSQPGVFADIFGVMNSSNDRFDESLRVPSDGGVGVWREHDDPEHQFLHVNEGLVARCAATIEGGELMASGLHIGSSYEEQWRPKSELRMTRWAPDAEEVPEATAGTCQRRDRRAWGREAVFLRDDNGVPTGSEKQNWVGFLAAVLGVGGLFEVCAMPKRTATKECAPAFVEANYAPRHQMEVGQQTVLEGLVFSTIGCKYGPSCSRDECSVKGEEQC
jgi:hypothetical protein